MARSSLLLSQMSMSMLPVYRVYSVVFVLLIVCNLNDSGCLAYHVKDESTVQFNVTVSAQAMASASGAAAAIAPSQPKYASSADLEKLIPQIFKIPNSGPADVDTPGGSYYKNDMNQGTAVSGAGAATSTSITGANIGTVDQLPSSPAHGIAKYSSCRGGECVPFYLCKNGSIVTDGETTIDIRFNAEVECANYLEVCCGPDARIAGKELTEVGNTYSYVPPNATGDIGTGGGGGGGAGAGASANTNGLGNANAAGGGVPATSQMFSRGCGYRNPHGVGFRISGDSDNEAQFAEFPWMTAVLKEDNGPNERLTIYLCGGSLIHPAVVLTAAHCVEGMPSDRLLIRVGEWDTQTRNEPYRHQDCGVQEVVRPADYGLRNLHNDIGLLFLRGGGVREAANVNTICLPPQDTSCDGQRCFASGWGKDVFGRQGRYQVILKKVELPIVAHDTCEMNLRTTRLGYHFQLHASFICAGGEKGRDTCSGDGGSPLVCPISGERNRYYQSGIVAWGIGCGTANIPGVYGNVAKFRNWIDSQMRERQLDTASYTHT